MYLQPLTRAWRLRAASPTSQAQANEWLEAAVPGSVHTDLMAASLIPDPFLGENERVVQWVAETDWEYECRFSPDPAISILNC